MDLLSRIKRLAIRGKLIWTGQAVTQMAHSGITREDVIESIINAQFVITKSSISRYRKSKKKNLGSGLYFDVYIPGFESRWNIFDIQRDKFWVTFQSGLGGLKK